MTEPSKTSPESQALGLKASGNALLAAGDYSGAITAYTEALALLPPTGGGIINSIAKQRQTGEEPSLHSILLSNRSHAYLSSGCVEKALEDAVCCAKLQPAWPKAHFRRAKALQQQGPQHRQDALDAYDDALAAAERMMDDANEDNSATTALIKEIKAARKKCARQLMETGSFQLSPEVAGLNCLLAVPEGATISDCRCLAATLDPATYDGVDDRTNTPIHATFPGDSGWPMFVPTITYKATQKPHPFPLCYYIIGPCTLTNACAKEMDDIFRPLPQHACHWPDGKATRTCPFCAGACIPGRGESFTMVVHLLVGKALVKGGFGNKLMMQLVCERCTHKRLLKATRYEVEDEKQFQMFFDNGKSGGGVDPLSRLRMLTESSHAVKTSVLWARATHTGLTSSITVHAVQRFQNMLAAGGVQVTQYHNSGSRNAAAEPCGEGEFFDSWMSRLDERAIYRPENDADRALGVTAGRDANLKEKSPHSERGFFIGSQEFHICQVARIKDLQKALSLFWNHHGADFRLQWTTWDAEERQSFAYETGRAFFESRMEHYNRRHTQYHHIEDPRPILNEPFGNVPSDKLSFLPELVGAASMRDSYDLLQLFRDRTSSDKTWVGEDVALIAKLKRENRLPKLQRNEKDGSYLCDYMGLEDPSTGPFVVLMGEREAEYNATGKLSFEMFMKPEEVVKFSEYRSLCEPFSENITIFNAIADGPIRSTLNDLLENGAATCAVCYIYAAMRQTVLLEYLQSAATHFCFLVGKDDPKEMERWTYQGTAGCYVCSARTKPDGSALFTCSLCRNVSYCSPECQKIDWKRHKAESCVTSPNYVAMDCRSKPLAPGSAQNRERKGRKGKKKGKK